MVDSELKPESAHKIQRPPGSEDVARAVGLMLEWSPMGIAFRFLFALSMIYVRE